MATTAGCSWKIGQQVDVKSRTWPGINKPGGVGHIVSIHYSNGGIVDSLDVMYIIGRRTDTYIDPEYIKPAALLERTGRSRRGREFLQVGETETEQKPTGNTPDDKENAEPKKKEPCKKKREGSRQAKKKPSQSDGKSDKANKPGSKQLAEKTKLEQKERNASSNKPVKKQKCKSRPEDALVEAAPLKKKHKKVAEKDPGVDAPPSQPQELPSIPKFVLTSDMAKANTISPMDVGDRPNSSNRWMPAAAISEEHDSSSEKEEHADPAKPPLRMTLKNVYEDKFQNASEFVSGLVGTKSDNNVGETSNPEAKNVVEEKSLGIQPDRLVLFVEHFSEILRKNDMMVAEDKVCKEINRQISSNAKSFSDEEVAICVTQLCDQNKAMKSDGFVYGI